MEQDDIEIFVETDLPYVLERIDRAMDEYPYIRYGEYDWDVAFKQSLIGARKDFVDFLGTVDPVLKGKFDELTELVDGEILPRISHIEEQVDRFFKIFDDKTGEWIGIRQIPNVKYRSINKGEFVLPMKDKIKMDIERDMLALSHRNGDIWDRGPSQLITEMKLLEVLEELHGFMSQVTELFHEIRYGVRKHVKRIKDGK